MSKNVHLTRVKLENERIVSQDDIDSQAAHVFISTVINEGPDSHHTLDHSNIDFTSTIPVPDILECINCINLATNTQHN
jgi:hypothetical protein